MKCFHLKRSIKTRMKRHANLCYSAPGPCSYFSMCGYEAHKMNIRIYQIPKKSIMSSKSNFILVSNLHINVISKMYRNLKASHKSL